MINAACTFSVVILNIPFILPSPAHRGEEEDEMEAREDKHTPGPFRFVQHIGWPYALSIYGGAPESVLISTPMPAHSSADKSVDDAINAVNFHKNERAHAARMNAEMIANFKLWAAAPDLLEALKALTPFLDDLDDATDGVGVYPEVTCSQRCRDAVAKARAAISRASR